jgi:UDP-GlcNAc:undecaprenyl-phosphate GlcNAc-1-phosphate transferase
MNALNMLDNMDGITSTVSIFILFSCLGVIFLHRDFENVFLITMIGVCGALCGFLYYNWNPSKMFMGDTGSQFLGVFLAAMGIRYLWNTNTDATGFLDARSILLAVIVFLMPVVDTTTVVINRLLKGQSPFVGGRDHTTHALVYAGLSERRVAIIIGLLCFSSLSFAFIIVKFLTHWSHFYTVIFSLWIVLVFSIFYYLSRKNIA